MSIERTAVTDKAYAACKNAGYTDAGIFGLFGNIYAESGFRTNNLENLCEQRLKEAGKEYCTDESYTAAIDAGKISCEEFLHPLPGKQYGYGLCQWTSPGRKSGLYTLVKQKGVSIADPDAQIEWLITELETSYKSVVSVLKTATSIREASDVVLAKFECPPDQGEHVKATRASYGEAYQKLYEKGETMADYKRSTIVDIMLDWNGAKQGSSKHLEIVNLYNSLNPLPRGYKLQTSDAWCAATWSAAAAKAGYLNIIPVECSCYYLIEAAKKMGIWQEDDTYTPNPGDAVLYDWDDGANYATTDNQGAPEHVGTVWKVVGSTIYVIEGNKSNAVGVRELKINGRYIRGFICPKYTETGTIGDTGTSGSSGTTAGNAKQVAYAQSLDKTLAGAYVTTSDLNLRYVPGEITDDNIIKVLPSGKTVQNYGYYTAVNGVKWFYVAVDGLVGFVSGAYLEKAGASTGSGSAGTTNASSESSGQTNSGSSAPSYKVGSNYTLQVELKVRKGPGTGYGIKSHSQLTTDGQKHDKDSDGALDAGTVVTCQEVRQVGSDIWIRCPSGWVAAYYQGDIYIR